MITLGVDLASQPKKTGVCLIRWDGGSAEVMLLECGATDSCLLELFDKAHKVGIDAPFGWPSCFTKAVAAYAHARPAPWPPEGSAALFPTTRFPHLRYRRTDTVVKDKACVTPLSVSSNWIAAPAMRTASLLAKRASNGEAIDRRGERGRFVEVYPAAALSVWGEYLRAWSAGEEDVPTTGYKAAKGKETRKKIVAVLAGATKPWLEFCGEYSWGNCEDSDDNLDALVAALVARAAAMDPNQCEPIPCKDRDRAKEEGWIALPKPDSLKRLPSEVALS